MLLFLTLPPPTKVIILLMAIIFIFYKEEKNIHIDIWGLKVINKTFYFCRG